MHALSYSTLLCKPYPKPSDIGYICMYTIKFAEVDEELEVPFTQAFNTNEIWSSSYIDDDDTFIRTAIIKYHKQKRRIHTCLPGMRLVI